MMPDIISRKYINLLGTRLTAKNCIPTFLEMKSSPLKEANARKVAVVCDAEDLPNFRGRKQ